MLSVTVEHERWTMGDLRAALEALTNVPRSRQTLLLPGVRSRLADHVLLRDLFPVSESGERGFRKPITMLGTRADEDISTISGADGSDSHGSAVVNDLDSLSAPPQSHFHHPHDQDAGHARAQVTPPSLALGPETSLEQQPFRFGLPFASDGSQGAPSDAEDSDMSSTEQQNHVSESATRTNGAALCLEEINEMLSCARTGHVFNQGFDSEMLDRHMTLNVLSEENFLKAISLAKNDMKMLAVLLVDCGQSNSNHQADGAADTVLSLQRDEVISRSTRFLCQTLQNELVAGILNENFLTFAADVGSLADGGAELLHRLGMHSLPAVLVLSDIGAGIAIVDMFASDFFDGSDAADSISCRLLQTLGTYEFVYDAARARRIASTERDEIISAQDEEFAQAQAEDRARTEREEAEKLAAEDAKAAALAEIEKAIAELPDQPEDGHGARLAIRLPDGRRVHRRFATSTSTVKDIFTWCVSLGVPHGTFALSLSFPRKTLTLERDGSCSLEAAGLVPTAALLVDLL